MEGQSQVTGKSRLLQVQRLVGIICGDAADKEMHPATSKSWKCDAQYRLVGKIRE